MDDKELHVHLNGDESMSFGSAYIASNSSANYKVRKVYLTQHPKYDIRISLQPLDPEVADLKRKEAEENASSDVSSEDGEEGKAGPIKYFKDTVLYKRTDYLGQKKTIHLDYDVNMLIVATAVHPDGSEEELKRFELKSIAEIMEKEVMQKETTTRPKLSLSFELSRSHLIQLNSAKIAADETVMEEIEKPKLKTKKGDDDTKEATDAGEEKASEEEGSDDKKEGDSEAAADSEAASEEKETTASDEPASEDDSAESEEEKEYREVIVPHTFDVDKIEETNVGARLLSKDQKQEAKKRIKALDQRDKDKNMADEAKNAYESLIYALRDWLREESNLIYVDEDERLSLLTKLDEGEEWLYDDGSNVSYTKYQEKSYELTVEQTKFNKRKEEYEKRLKLLPQIIEGLDESKSKAHMIREGMPWVTEQEQKDLVEKVEDMREWIDKM